MAKVWCVRAEYGTYSEDFIQGGYVAIGWVPSFDLAKIQSRDELYSLYNKDHPDDTSKYVVGVQVGQISRFLLDIQEGDFVITPGKDTDELYYGVVQANAYYYFQGKDRCPYKHRKKIKWEKEPLKRYTFSVPFQNTIRSSLTVFGISQEDEFFLKIGKNELIVPKPAVKFNPTQIVLNQILELQAKEFEILVGHLLTAMGFEETEVTGKTGDGGVDVIGELNASNLAKVKVFVQAKRYKPDHIISARTVRELRQAIPFGGQGAFITTSDFQNEALNVATEAGFPRIGLINGEQLVDLLVEHWDDIPSDFQELLGLRPGLVQV